MTLDEFALDLVKSVTPDGHLWVGSGRTTVQPVARTAAGVGAFYSPPVAAHGVSLAVVFTVDGFTVPDTGNTGKGDIGLLYQGGTWYPDKLVRHGSYHHRKNGVLRSFAVESTLVPLADAAGYVLRLKLTNRSPQPLSLSAHPRLEPGKVELRPLSDWVFGLPRGGDPLVETAPGAWQTAGYGPQTELRVQSETRTVVVFPGESHLSEVVVLAGPRTASRLPLVDATIAARRTSQVWKARVERFTARLPDVTSTVPGLADYYRRSVASGLVCLWEDPAFVTNPFLATCGLDGGGVNTYLWDLGGYVPQAATLLLGSDLVPIAQALARVPLETYFSIAPDGTPSGTPYSYSAFSFLSLVWSISCLVGPDEALYREARRLFELAETQFPRHPDPKFADLLDYGEQRNMLEMRGAGWEHLVASPNAERAWCLDRLADLGLHFGAVTLGEAAGLRTRAERIRLAIREHLWDRERGEFKSVFPDGHVEYARSIQAFDALRAGACDPEMEAALLAQVVDGQYLGDYGATSVSRADTTHYETNDPDWSGAGAYTGDPPALALTLYERGHAALGWDVLRRLFWMGQHLPYFPQEHRCDTPTTVAHKRANVISGLGGAEALIFGLTGLQVDLGGSLSLFPNPPPGGEVSFRGLQVRGATLDVVLRPGHATITVNGTVVLDGPPALVTWPTGRAHG